MGGGAGRGGHGRVLTRPGVSRTALPVSLAHGRPPASRGFARISSSRGRRGVRSQAARPKSTAGSPPGAAPRPRLRRTRDATQTMALRTAAGTRSRLESWTDAELRAARLQGRRPPPSPPPTHAPRSPAEPARAPRPPLCCQRLRPPRRDPSELARRSTTMRAARRPRERAPDPADSHGPRTSIPRAWGAHGRGRRGSTATCCSTGSGQPRAHPHPHPQVSADGRQVRTDRTASARSPREARSGAPGGSVSHASAPAGLMALASRGPGIPGSRPA